MKNHTSIQGFNSMLKSQSKGTPTLAVLRQLTAANSKNLLPKRNAPTRSEVWSGWWWWG
ncbi:MAG: hypothetical protein KDE09_02110 [Anaerolineales bacterium]|nr:hypothetical protein [Anaerolineales bacterium]MCB0016550.1 hypothetical protein [Anaerolineales bacterium]MCB0026728.1 hypothetical protein [Anaerolineales bacterium]MCB8962121.1 hypothetical protein [Ardenticatenales bacterium]